MVKVNVGGEIVSERERRMTRNEQKSYKEAKLKQKNHPSSKKTKGSFCLNNILLLAD